MREARQEKTRIQPEGCGDAVASSRCAPAPRAGPHRPSADPVCGRRGGTHLCWCHRGLGPLHSLPHAVLQLFLLRALSCLAHLSRGSLQS